MNDTLEPPDDDDGDDDEIEVELFEVSDDDPSKGRWGPDGNWLMGRTVDFTKLSTPELRARLRECNDRLVAKKAPRPLISPTVPAAIAKELGQPNLALDEEAKDIHSQYWAIRYALMERGIKTKDPKK